jgi:hypothetical protein
MNDRRLSALLSPVVLHQLRAAAKKQLSSGEASDRSWCLAEIDRAPGDLATAASGYAACASAAAARFLFELIRGEAANPEPSPQGPRPVPFVLLQDFLPATELATIRGAVDRLRPHFRKAGVGRGADRRLDLAARVGHAVAPNAYCQSSRHRVGTGGLHWRDLVNAVGRKDDYCAASAAMLARSAARRRCDATSIYWNKRAEVEPRW